MTFKIEGISPQVMSHLEEESNKLKISVNLLILRLIEQGIGLSSKPKRVLYHDLDHLAGTWSAEEHAAFHERIK